MTVGFYHKARRGSRKVHKERWNHFLKYLFPFSLSAQNKTIKSQSNFKI
jgi:hypothetical protein